MAVKPILTFGDPALLQVSQEVIEFATPELAQLIDDMRDTMQSVNGAGLAAPQIGVFQRIVIFSVQDNPRYPNVDLVPETVLINPKIEVLGETVSGMWEGCLSVPGMRGYIERPDYIRYTGFDIDGNKIDRTVQGFHATVVQHECDHLDGILYPMRLQDISKFGFESELVQRSDYP